MSNRREFITLLGGAALRVECSKCERKGRYQVHKADLATLILVVRQHGATAAL
jgi:hypothetical protein